MSKRMLSLWLVLCAFAVPAFGQAVSFVDAQGRSVTAYREGERVNVLLVAPVANFQSNARDEAYVVLSARDSGDQESLSLVETGPDTGVFERAVRLGFAPAYPQNGVLQTARPAGATGPFDRISVSYQIPYGSVLTAEADVTGPVLSFLDSARNETTDAVLGFRLYVRAVDPSANGSNGPDTDTVRLVSGSDEEFLTLHETGPYTGIFEGSIPLTDTSVSSGDGTLQAAPGTTVEARLEDGSGGLFAAAQATTAARLISFRDAAGSPLSALLEDSTVQIHLLDAGYSYPYLPSAHASSLLTGDEEDVSFAADPATPGLFKGTLRLTRSFSYPYDGLLRALSFDPPRPDTVTATACPNGCATVSAPTARSVTRLVDAEGADVTACAVGLPVRVRVVSNPGYSEAYVRLESLTTSDTLTALFFFDANGIAEGEVPTAAGTATADSILQVQPGEILRASYLNAVGQPETSDTATVSTALLEIVDAAGSPVDRPLLGAPLFLRAIYPGANTDSGLAETVSARIDVNHDRGFYRDRETLALTETGPDTGVFTGSILLEQQVQLSYPPDGILESGYDDVPPYHPDVIRATLSDASVSAVVTLANVQFVNSQGNEVASYLEGSLIHFRVEAPLFDQPGQQDSIGIEVRSYGGDWEWTYLSETGTDTGIFTGSMPSGTGPVAQFSGTLDVQAGDTLEALVQTRSGSAGSRTTIGPPVPPVAQNDTASTLEDTPVTVNVLANDSDPSGLPLTVTAASVENSGTVTVNPDSTITFTPDPESGGYTENVTYTVSNGLATDTATLAVWVEPVNDPPVAVADAANLIEDSYVILDLISNDEDVDGETWRLEVISIGPAAHGALTPDPLFRPQYRYTPDPDFNGTDVFPYVIRDQYGATATGTITITVGASDDPPFILDDATTTSEDTPVTVSVLTNDQDADDPITVLSVTQGAHGSVVINGGTTVTYTPAANFSGTDSFTYTAGKPDFNGEATVTVTVTPANDAPVAVNDSATTNEDAAVTVPVLGNDSDLDGDSLTISAITQGTRGSVAISGSNVIYTPNANYNGTDSFTYTISDGKGGTATATVSITINAVNDAPDAINDAAATNEDTAVTISVLANDVDVDGEALTVTGVTQGSRGAVTLNANGTATYVPAPNTNGADAFSYTVRDAAGATDTATVTVVVAAINDPPGAAADSATTREGVAVTVDVRTNDSDLEGNPLTVTGVSQPANGTAVLNANGTVTYTAAANFNGTDTFTYTLSDGQGGTATGTVTVTVKDALERVAVLATHGVWIQTGADVLSGDVIVNQTGTWPFLDGGSSELSIAGTVTTPAGWDVQANRVNVAAGSTVASDAFFNQLTGSVNGPRTSPLTLPVFATLPAFRTATPGTTDVNVGTNGTRTLTPGSYRDLIVGRKGTVTFTGGVYHFRSIQVSSEAKLFFSAAADVRVQQKLSTLGTTTLKPAAGATIDGSDVVFFVAGLNGTGGALSETPKAVEIGTDNVVWANVYAPNGTIWWKDRSQARGSSLGKDVQVGPDVQVTLDSSWAGQ